jgi:hypothetical protein
MTENLSEIIYEAVTPEYGWGKYGEFRVLIRRKDGYINATKLCKDGGKRFEHWQVNKESKLLVSELRSLTDFSVSETLFDLSNDLRGTYVHQDLIPHIASWVSPQFAIKVSKIVNNFIVREYKEEIMRHKVQIEAKDSTITAMQKKLDHIIHQNELLLQDNQGLMEKCDTMNDNLDFTMEKLISTADVSVPNTHDNQLTEQFVLFKKDRVNDSDSAYNYGVIRAQRRSVNRMLAFHKRRHPRLTVVYSIQEQPNSVNLYNRFKSSYKGASFANNSIRLLNGVSEDEFVACLRDIHNDRNTPVEEVNERVSEPLEGREESRSDRLFTVDRLQKQNVKQLKDICRAKGYKGFSTLSKTELIHHIIECQ